MKTYLEIYEEFKDDRLSFAQASPVERNRYMVYVMDHAEYDPKVPNYICLNIERVTDNGKIITVLQPDWDWNRNFYRFIEKPKYEPYQEVNPDIIGKVVIDNSLNFYMITGINAANQIVIINNEEYDLNQAFVTFTYTDKSPFGREV